MTGQAKKVWGIVLSLSMMAAIVLTTVFCLISPQTVRKDPNSLPSDKVTSSAVSTNSLIKSGGAVDADVLAALLAKVGSLEASDSTTQWHLGELNGGTPVTVKLFDTITVEGYDTYKLNAFTSKYWQPVYRTGNVLTLWMVEPYTTTQFYENNRSGKDYASSNIRKKMISTYTTLNSTFNLDSKNLITTPSSLPVKWQTSTSYQLDLTQWHPDYNDEWAINNLMDGGLENDKLWLPSHAEVFNNYLANWRPNLSDLTVRNGIWQTNYQDRIGYTWLRSSDNSYPNACACSNNGSYDTSPITYSKGVRPALHLNLASVASAANLKGDVISGSLIKSGGAVDGATFTTLLDKMGGWESDSAAVKDLTQINGGTPLTLKLFDTVADTTNAMDKLTASYWQVVYRTGNVLTLWMTAPYTTSKFDDNTNVYENSAIRTLLKDTVYPVLDTKFNLNNKNLIVSPGDLPVKWQTDTSLQLDIVQSSLVYNSSGNIMSGGAELDKLWIPSVAEVFYNYYQSGSGAGGGGSSGGSTESVTGLNGFWNASSATRSYTNMLPIIGQAFSWLRSTGWSGDTASSGDDTGTWESGSRWGVVDDVQGGVRPALHIDLDTLYAAIPTVTAAVDTTEDGGARMSVNGGTLVTGHAEKLLDSSRIPMQIDFTASPGYTIKSVTLNGTALDLSATSAAGVEYTAEYSKDKRTLTLTLTSITADCNIVAKSGTAPCVIEVYNYPIAGGMVTGAGSYTYGAEVTLTAVAAAGYRFDAWFCDGVYVSDTTYTFTARKDMVIMAMFHKLGNYHINDSS